MERQEFERWINKDTNVLVHLIPRAGTTWIEEGIITELFSDDWFRIEFKGCSNEWHLDQVDRVEVI